MLRFSLLSLSLCAIAVAQTRPTPPSRDPHTPGYVEAKDLPDGANAAANADGNFVLGPTHNPAPESTVQEGVPHGDVFEFTMESADSKIYPGIAREPKTFGEPDPSNPAKLIVTTSHPAAYTRKVAVYVPKQYVPGTAAPFIVGADGRDFDQQRLGRRAGQREGPGIRHHVRPLCGIRRNRSAAACRERSAREVDQGPGSPRDDGR